MKFYSINITVMLCLLTSSNLSFANPDLTDRQTETLQTQTVEVERLNSFWRYLISSRKGDKVENRLEDLSAYSTTAQGDARWLGIGATAVNVYNIGSYGNDINSGPFTGAPDAIVGIGGNAFQKFNSTAINSFLGLGSAAYLNFVKPLASTQYAIGSGHGGHANNLLSGYTFAYQDAGTPASGSILTVGGFNDLNYRFQIQSSYLSDQVFFRRQNGDAGGVWGGWKRLLTEDDLTTANLNRPLASTQYAIGSGHGGHADNLVSGYTFAYQNAGTPANGSILTVGGFNDLNYKFQIQASYSTDQIFFRRQNGDAGGAWGAWQRIVASEELNAFLPLTGGKVSGSVGIAATTLDPDAKLTVGGKIHSREIKVTATAGGADFVFEKEYNLKPLAEVAEFISANKHLPEIASAKEMEKNGIELGEMNIKLLQKIEELTLYMIEFKKEMELVKQKNQNLEEKVSKLEGK